ncbi:MAG: hypothetical protein LC797_13325 [Chloroflexi bacterium]|nr:hypothetical protein [Chloroflexota bacterium]
MSTVRATPSSVYEQLGLTPVINARGNNTVLGGSTPSARVHRAMQDVERYYVDMQQLLERSGEVIAELLGAEAAYVTPGAAAALALGTAACIAGADPDKIARLPDTTGLANTVLIQAGHRYHYEHAVTVPGGRLVEVGDAQGTTAEQLRAALVYPLDKFRGYAREGADLVAFGAKYIGALNASGILCGRKDLVAAATMHGFIGFETVAWEKSFGRPLKLDRQTIVGVVTALQEWLETDHEARLAGYERRLQAIAAEIEGAPGVTLSLVNGDGPAPRVLCLTFDPARGRHDATSVADRLWHAVPAIAVGRDGDSITINPVTLREEDDGVVAARLGELLL